MARDREERLGPRWHVFSSATGKVSNRAPGVAGALCFLKAEEKRNARESHMPVPDRPYKILLVQLGTLSFSHPLFVFFFIFLFIALSHMTSDPTTAIVGTT